MQQQRRKKQQRPGGRQHQHLVARVDTRRVREKVALLGTIARRRSGAVRSRQYAQRAVLDRRVVEEEHGGDDLMRSLLGERVPVRVVLVPGELRTLARSLQIELASKRPDGV